MNNLVLCLVACASLLGGRESSFQYDEKLLSVEEGKTHFFYLAGGVDVLLPTISIGYQKLYGSFGSDLSVSGSFFPGLKTRWGPVKPTVLPSVQYKQLFFNNSGHYCGLTTKTQWIDGNIVSVGAVTGRHLKRKKGKDFFEAGVTPFCYSFSNSLVGEGVSLCPFFYLSYGFML